jgi:hypothetical protein
MSFNQRKHVINIHQLELAQLCTYKNSSRALLEDMQGVSVNPNVDLSDVVEVIKHEGFF